MLLQRHQGTPQIFSTTACIWPVSRKLTQKRPESEHLHDPNFLRPNAPRRQRRQKSEASTSVRRLLQPTRIADAMHPGLLEIFGLRQHLFYCPDHPPVGIPNTPDLVGPVLWV